MANNDSFLLKILNANDLMQAKSIAEQARGNIFMYRVGMSQSIGDVQVAVAINKYIETMCGIFTLIISGVNPIAQTNSEIKDIIKGISAEAFNPISLEHYDFVKPLSQMSVEYDFGNIGVKTPPRIGKNAISVESTFAYTYNDMTVEKLEELLAKKNEDLKNTDDNEIKKAINKDIDEIKKMISYKGSVSSKQYSVDTRFAEKLEKYPGYPTILKIEFKVPDGNITVPIAIKANPICIGSEEMVMFIESTLAGRVYHFTRYFKWKSGEITTSQYLLGTDIAKRDKKLYQNLGRNPIYMEFMKRKANSKFIGALKAIHSNTSNTIGPTGSLVVTTDDLVQATKLDIRRFTRNNELIQHIMKETFIMCFAIVDVPMGVVNFYFMSYKEPFRLNFSELGVGTNVDSNKQLEQAILELSRKVT